MLLAQRLHTIAAIHALAQWFTDHPDVPLPWSIEVNADPAAAPDAPDDERLAAMDRFAVLHNAQRHSHGPHHFADVKLAEAKTHGTAITYVMATTIKGGVRAGDGTNTNGHPHGCQCPSCGGR
jgi:hypothetical protein